MGIISLESDMNVYESSPKVKLLDLNEIETQNPTALKQIFDESGKFVSVTVIKGGKTK
jgi:hypothetical protein